MRYIVSYIAYQHADFGSDDYDGWQDFYTSQVFDNKDKAFEFYDRLKKDRFFKDIFVSKEMKDVEYGNGNN